MDNLTIDDEYIKSIGSHYKKCSKKLQIAVNEYISILTKIKNEAVSAGEFKDALEDFIKYASTLKDIISNWGTEIETTCNRYLSDIDKKDDYLY